MQKPRRYTRQEKFELRLLSKEERNEKDILRILDGYLYLNCGHTRTLSPLPWILFTLQAIAKR